MTRVRGLAALTLAFVALCTFAVRADVRTEQKTKVELGGMIGRMMNMFGGKAAQDGTTSTIAVKGERRASLNEMSGQIVDLSEEKVYDLDVRKKNYKVTTFAELRKRWEDAQKKAAGDADKQQSSAPSKADKNEKQMEVDVDVKNTGAKKTINGFDTKESILTITLREKGKTLEQGGGLVLTSDMWLAPKIAAMKEIVDFQRRYDEKLYGASMAGASPEQMAAAMAMYPQMKQALSRMTVEGEKIDGTPIQMTTTIDSVKSADQMAEEAKNGNGDSGTSGGGMPASVGGLLGGLAKRAAAKKAGGDEPPKARSTFMTSTTEVLKVATTVSADDVAVPAGYKENK